jgi:MerR family transcriptional regulator, redox-sensitive transcriptional activator SoxR
MDEITIGELARRTGVPASAIRYYEARGLLPAPRRVRGQRRYGSGAVRLLGLLRFAQRAGFSLPEIRLLVREDGREATLGERWDALARTKVVELDAMIARAMQMRMAVELGRECGCVRIEECTLPGSGIAPAGGSRAMTARRAPPRAG